MKKRILFVMSQFNMGGIERELLCLLNSIDQEKYTTELFLTGRGGQLEAELPEFTKVHYPDGNAINSLLVLIKRGNLWKAAKKVYCYFRMKLAKGCAKDYWGVKAGAILPDRYDCAIAYDGLDMAVISMVEEVNAEKRLVWEHGPLIGVDNTYRKYSKKASRSFDKIVCVSEALKKEFAAEYQLPDSRFCVLYNLVDVSSILRQADDQISDLPHTNGQTLVTVGRLHPQKGQERIPQITRMLIDAGYDIYWYLVGDGILRPEIEELCRKYDVADRLVILGAKNNPYPYIKNCNIYVQTSSWEGWCLAVQEARILCKPMVVTPLPVIHEQIVNGVNGLITADLTPESIFESIRLLLDHPEMQEEFVQKLVKENHENISEVQKLYTMIESDIS